MVTDGNQTYCGDHFETYRNIESLCFAPEPNMVLQINTSKMNKQTHRKRDLICGEQRQGLGEG